VRSLRVVLPLVVAMLLGGQGVAAAATPSFFRRALTQDTSGSNGTALVSRGDEPGDDEGDPAGDDGGPASDGGNPADEGDKSTGDDDNPDPSATGAQPPPVQALTRSVATSRVKNVLSRRFGQVYTRGSRKRVSCRPRGAGSYVCSLSWRYHRQRYNGRAIVTASGPVKTHVVSRRAS
jgi:hypothetical protein